MVPDISNKHSVFICRVRQSKDCGGTMFVEHIMNHSPNDSVIFHSEALLKEPQNLPNTPASSSHICSLLDHHISQSVCIKQPENG